jgi:hypothetical protein
MTVKLSERFPPLPAGRAGTSRRPFKVRIRKQDGVLTVVLFASGRCLTPVVA